MRNVLTAAAALAALAGSAEAAKVKRHTWYMLQGSTATCVISDKTPEEFQAMASGAAAHQIGATAEAIGPDNVVKDAHGDIQVLVKGSLDGQPTGWIFYTSKDDCEKFISDSGIKPQQAPSGDIN